MSSSIKALPPVVAAQIRSSVALVSLREVVVGLLQNSLDCGATTVHIDVDFARGGCTVEDDGPGVPVEYLHPDSDFAQPYYTSKFDEESPGEIYGFRGVFLASLGAVSILNVVSRQRGDKEPHALVIYQGQRLGTGGDAGRSHEQLRSRTHGTKVIVHDLFGNMPVRVRQRPTGDDGRKARDRAFRSLKHDLSAFALAWNTPVSIHAKGTDQGHDLRISPQAHHDELSRLRQDGDGYSITRLCSVLTQVAAGQYVWSSWVQASARGDGMTVKGLISKVPSTSKSTQFISLGIHPLQRDDVFSSLYETINNTMSASSFGTSTDQTEVSSHNGQDGALKRHTSERMVRVLESDRNPMYYIRIEFDIPYNKSPRPKDLRTRDITNVTNILEAMIAGFLENQNLYPRKKRRKRKTSEGTPPLASSSIERANDGHLSTNALVNWTRMKSAVPLHVRKNYSLSESNKISRSREEQSDDNASLDLSSDFDEEAAVRLCQDVEPIQNAAGDQLISWLDEETGERLRINSRTGMVENTPDGNVNSDSAASSDHFTTRAPKKRITLPLKQQSDDRIDETMAAWADDVVNKWVNPVFEQQEQCIPRATLEDEQLDRFMGQNDQSANQPNSFENAFRGCLASIEARVSQAQLRDAEVIGQVDSKFILARLPARDTSPEEGTGDHPLILIDQHAADERIRFEALLHELCRPAEDQLPTASPVAITETEGYEGAAAATTATTPSRFATVHLEQPLEFDVSLHDCELLANDAAFFAAWGIVYSIHRGEQARKASRTSQRHPCSGLAPGQLVVVALSPVIAERCRLDPALARDLLLTEARRRDDEGRSGTKPAGGGGGGGGGGASYASSTATTTNTTTTMAMTLDQWRRDPKLWLGLVHDCPRGLLDLVASRACRSAIMFNDRLSRAQCVDIVRRLAAAALPFQCAHGRPSLLPIASAGTLAALRSVEWQENGEVGSHGDEPSDFRKAWAAWMAAKNADNDVGGDSAQ